jgi:hypothetical protein
MKRLIAPVMLFAAVYAACLVLHASAVGPAPQNGGVAWYVWHAAGAGCLSASAVELVVWGVWLWMRCTGESAASGVPRLLTPADHLSLVRARPALALLMPAHNEASTAEDRESLVQRIFDILLLTPSYSTFFLLADSPVSQRDNELHVIREIKRRLRESGRGYYQDRIVLEEYRDKPPSWRHKCGSLLTWIRRYGEKFKYMFILDADSSLAEEDPRRPETCDVVERMLIAMRNDASLAMVQAAIEIRDYHTLWGWIQAINARIGSSYYFRVFSYVYQRAVPCYGHNCLFRVSDFASHVKNTLLYTSHDHIDSSDLAAAGRSCVLSDAVVTYEQPEDTLPGWLKRECRWSRGNGQWLVYLLRKWPLPLGPAVYLSLGILQYVWALLASVLLISAAVLVHQDVSMVGRPDALPARLLIGVVLFTLLVPKLAAAPTLPEFFVNVLSSAVLGPTLVLFQGLSFLLGAFGSKWVPRGARVDGFDLRHVMRISTTFFPALLLGLVLWNLIRENISVHTGGTLIVVMVVGLMLSPVVGLVLSWPRWKESMTTEPRPDIRRRSGIA